MKDRTKEMISFPVPLDNVIGHYLKTMCAQLFNNFPYTLHRKRTFI